MPNGLRIEHLCDIIREAQSRLVLNLSVFTFVYIYFNVPPTRITDLVRNVLDERFIDMEHSPLPKGRFTQSNFGLIIISIFLCMMKNIGVHTIQFSYPIIS